MLKRSELIFFVSVYLLFLFFSIHLYSRVVIKQKFYKCSLLSVVKMKVYLYEINAYANVLAFTHGMGETQTRLYIPGTGVLGFRKDEIELDVDARSSEGAPVYKKKLETGLEVDFFSDDLQAIADAEAEFIKWRSDGSGSLRKMDVPGQLIDRLVLAGKMANHAKAEFTKDAASLIRAFLL